MATTEQDKQRVQSWWGASVSRGQQGIPWFVQSLIKRVEREEGQTFDVHQGRWIPRDSGGKHR